jgi:hypothetical protein
MLNEQCMRYLGGLFGSVCLCALLSASVRADPEDAPAAEPELAVLDLGTMTVDLAPGGEITAGDAGTGFVPGVGSSVAPEAAPTPTAEGARTPLVQTGCSYVADAHAPSNALVLALFGFIVVLWSRRRGV